MGELGDGNGNMTDWVGWVDGGARYWKWGFEWWEFQGQVSTRMTRGKTPRNSGFVAWTGHLLCLGKIFRGGIGILTSSKTFDLQSTLPVGCAEVSVAQICGSGQPMTGPAWSPCQWSEPISNIAWSAKTQGLDDPEIKYRTKHDWRKTTISIY